MREIPPRCPRARAVVAGLLKGLKMNPLQETQTLGGAVEEALTPAMSGDAKTTRLREFAKLTTLKGQLEVQLKDIAARLSQLEEPIIEAFQQDGMQSVNVDGFNIHLKRTLFAGAKGDKSDLMATLKGMDESWSILVQDNVNYQSLNARVRELELGDDGMPIVPAELVDVLNISEQYKLGARKSK